MTAAFTIAEISMATNGRILTGDPETMVAGVSTDSRTIVSGQLFIALRGEKFDGHAFLDAALERGAAALLVSSWDAARTLPAVPVVQVADTLSALQALARHHRRRFAVPVIGVTGSNGKTTTKDMIAAVLNEMWPTLKTHANFNNEVGLPLTLLALTAEHRAAVVEMGMRGPGEIRQLAAVALPTVAVVTNVAETHIERLGSIEAIAAAKGELVESVDETGTAVLNYDDHRVAAMAGKTRARVIYYGTGAGADVRGTDIHARGEEGTHFTVTAGGRSFSVCLPLPGRHNVMNALAAAAVGFHLGVGEEAIAAGLAKFQPSAMRMQIQVLPTGVKIINDAYNASPLSMRAALATLRDLKSQRSIAVFGDMLELGAFSEAAHQSVGESVVENAVDFLITVGKDARHIARGAVTAGMPPERVSATATHEEAIAVLSGLLKSGDTVLVKGSRGMKMEQIITALTL